MNKLLISGAVGALMSMSALADNFYFDLGATYYEYDNDTLLEQETGGNINLGYRFGEGVALELGYTKVDTTFINAASRDIGTSDPRLGALIFFAESKRFSPFFYFGMGNLTIEKDLNENDESDFNLQAGLGVKAYLTDHLYGRLDTRVLHLDTNLDHYATTLSIGYRFGGASSKKVKKIDTQPAAEPAAVLPSDMDNDGVEDSLDQCSDTMKGLAVDAKGCPLDSDKDGVPDYKDQCRQTDAELKVDARGCAVVLKEAVSIDLSVEFASGSSAVDAKYYNEIGNVARFLEQYKGTNVVIEGHTDSSGSATYNKRLSQLRADAVANILLTQFYIPSARVKAIGYGEERPIADDSTPQGKAANRRVVAVVSAQKEVFQTK